MATQEQTPIPQISSTALTDEEVARIRGRRAAVRASLACSGMFLTDEEERLLDEMEEQKMTLEQRDARVMEFIGAKEAQRRSQSGGAM